MEADNNEAESVQTVEIIKQPGQTLGFYIREGNGADRTTGVFISRIDGASVVAKNGLLRVNDEIRSVNSVDVTRMSLDDVVILMSIAKCLVLTVRFQKPQTTLNAILAGGGGGKEADDDGGGEGRSRRQQPVVVLKSGFANSFSGVEDRSPDEFLWRETGRGRYDERGGGGGHPGLQVMGNEGKVRVHGRDQSLDSHFASKWLGYGNQERVTGEQANTATNGPHGNSLPSGCSSEFEVPFAGKGGRANDLMYGSHQRRHDYASDTDVTYHSNQTPYEQVMSRCNPYRGAPSVNHGFGSGHHQHQHHQLSHGGARDVGSFLCYNGSLSNEQYSSDSEIITNYHHRSSTRGDRINVRHSNGRTGSHGSEHREMFYSLPHRSRDEYKELYRGIQYQQKDHSNRAFVNHPINADIPYIDVNSEFGHQNEITSTRKHIQAGNLSSLTDAAVNWSNKTPSPSPSSSAAAYAPNPSRTSPGYGLHRLTRKMSTDSLFEYKTYQTEEEDLLHGSDFLYSRSPQTRDGHLFSAADFKRHLAESSRPGGALYRPLSTMTLSRAQQGTGKAQQMMTSSTARSSSSSEDQRSKGTRLAKVPMKIQTDTFQSYQSGGGVGGGGVDPSTPGFTGMLYVHIFCAHGLKPSRTAAALRDLYCVTEVGGLNVARTMIRTGAINFDWDEEFEIDVRNAKRLAFLVYSWDPRTRHTALCFSGAIASLAAVLLDRRPQFAGQYQRLAVKLEPRGTLYVELSHTDAAAVLVRAPAGRRSAVFGVELRTLVHREGLGGGGGGGVPVVVVQCVAEVERRGLDHVGLYRICGSARRKAQLREEIERSAQDADLSVNAVSDVNVITSLLKDFLRELPEPLCTNALYQMLMDALSVQVPGDHRGNTQLMLDILACLPKVNQDTLAYVLSHLKRVSLKCDVNKMTTHSLAICFGPVLVCPSTAQPPDPTAAATAAAAAGGSLAVSASSPPPPPPPPSSSQSQSLTTTDFDRQIELLTYLLDIWTADRSSSTGTLKKNTSNSGGNVPATSHSSPARQATMVGGGGGALHRRSVSDSGRSRRPNGQPPPPQEEQQTTQDAAVAWEFAEASSC